MYPEDDEDRRTNEELSELTADLRKIMARLDASPGHQSALALKGKAREIMVAISDLQAKLDRECVA